MLILNASGSFDAHVISEVPGHIHVHLKIWQIELNPPVTPAAVSTDFAIKFLLDVFILLFYKFSNSGTSTQHLFAQLSSPFSASWTPFAPSSRVQGKGSSFTTCLRNNSH